MRKLKLLTCLLGVLMAPVHWTFAQWVEQTIHLETGWNTFWLDVDPEPCEPQALFASIGFQSFDSIWSFLPDSPGGQGTWVCYHNDPAVPLFINTLSCLQGQRGYLINASSPTATAGLKIKGRPVNRKTSFSGGKFNPFGIGFGGVTPPSFEAYFSDPNVTGKVRKAFRLNDATFTQVPLSDRIETGTAYWLEVSQDFAYSGPVDLNGALEGFQFGIKGYVDHLSVTVPAGNSRTVEIRSLVSAPPPAGKPADASGGNVDWLEFRNAAGKFTTLADGTSLTVPAGQSRGELEIRAKRLDVLDRAPATVDGTNSLYQALIEIESGGQKRILGAGMEVLPQFSGIWVGQARLTQVSRSSLVEQDPKAVGDGAQPLVMSLILSIPGPEGGKKQLLDEVPIQVDRDGRKLKYHYSAILFHQPVELTGTVHIDSTLSGLVVLDSDHPLNPYRHRYNPEHREGYRITRNIKLTFNARDPDPLHQELGLDESDGDNELTGIYEETIQGISLEPITVRGCFKLYRLSETTQL
jgi:hypothetical protein